MYTAHYPPEILNLINSFDRHYDHDLPQLADTIKVLDAYATKHQDHSLKGFVHYHAAKLALLTGQDVPEYRRHLIQAIRLLRSEDDADTLGGCYNLAGVECMEYCNYDLAISHFLTALQVLEPLHDHMIAAMVNSNIGTLYADIGDYAQALHYMQECIRLMELNKPTGDERDIYLVGVCASGWHAMEVGDAAAARSAYDKLWQLKMDVSVPPETMLSTNVLAFEARYAYEAGEFEDADRLIKELIGSLHHVNRISAAADDLCRFAHFMIWAERFQDALQILTFLDQLDSASISPAERIMIAEAYIRYATARRDDALLKTWQKAYYDLNHAIVRSKNDIYTFSIELARLRDAGGKNRLLDLEEDVRIRRQKDVDATTLLPSRRQFNQDLLEAYRRAVRDDTPLGIAAIEIDGYEDLLNQYARSVVHVFLNHVAECLRDVATDATSCYRYGAGRFLMIYRNTSNHEIYARATLLQEAVAAVPVVVEELGTSIPVTISQGISNRVPSERVHIWDFVSDANNAIATLRRQDAVNEIAFNAHKH